MHRSPWPVLAVAVCAALLSDGAVWLSWRRGWILYYGDAESHLNIARRVLDSRTPGFDQLGTAWLPLPHLLMVRLAARDDLWQSGLAGAIPSAVCFVLGVTFLFAAARRVFASTVAGAITAALYALNPNVLYLASTPMNEMVFFAALAALLYFTVRFRAEQSLWTVAGAGAAALAGTLTRYEGWFLIPFAALYFLVVGKWWRRWVAAFLFAAIASLGPLAWLAYNRWLYSNFWEFYSGPYGPRAIQGGLPYPGLGDWHDAVIYFGWAVRACAGAPLFFLGAAGLVAALWKRAVWPVLLLALPGLFYVWSMHSTGGTPIYLPNVWPHSYYNTRYGLALVPLAAFCAGAIAALLERWRQGFVAGLVLVAIAIEPWLLDPRPESWITWKESEVNSVARRAWTHETAEFFRAHYRPGDGIFTSFGDYTGVFREAGIPLRATLTGDNGPAFESAILRPDLMLWEQWAMVMGGDPVQTAVNRARRRGPNYDLVKKIIVKRAPVIEIYERNTAPPEALRLPDENSVRQSARRQK
jgi:dolichyl-phosphate-mannose-protein mannosyltransferase